MSRTAHIWRDDDPTTALCGSRDRLGEGVHGERVDLCDECNAISMCAMRSGMPPSPSTSPERGAIRELFASLKNLREAVFGPGKAPPDLKVVRALSELAALEAERDCFSRSILAMGAANDDLRAQLDKRDEDTKRLDQVQAWLDEDAIVKFERWDHDGRRVFNSPHLTIHVLDFQLRGGKTETIREAIDAARVSADASKERKGHEL